MILQEGGSAGQAEKAKLNSESRIGRHTGSPDSDRAQIVTLHGFGLHAIGARGRGLPMQRDHRTRDAGTELGPG